MFYFKVKRDSNLYKKLIDAAAMKGNWFANMDKLYNAVGLPALKQIVMSPDTLYYPEKPPEELQDQFRKYRDSKMGCYIAKVNSPLNKKWNSLCAEHGLAFVPTLNTIVQESLFNTPYIWGSGLKTIAKIGDDYYLDGEKELPEADFLEQVAERDYLEARLKVTAQSKN